MGMHDQPHRPSRALPGPQIEQSIHLGLMGDQLGELSSAQQRMQRLLDAVRMVSRDLDLPVVLRRIVSTAMELVDARYGALGVLTEQGESPSEFIAVGLTEQQRGDLSAVEFPRGGGLLGHLIRHPEPLRVEDIAHHPKSVGFPHSRRGALAGELSTPGRCDRPPLPGQPPRSPGLTGMLCYLDSGLRRSPSAVSMFSRRPGSVRSARLNQLP
ncbi:GAF domain-containing protein [Kitasatospora sp. MAP12-15]|uniref:GAF domain-containing protein n=1 Tax=unclassified Kitasatospora TaxID=2633591 RepID=UPI00247493A9|nr:GAF domain-containing protein [Kitasatospora sp. MAP12-44]MDH6115092.1 GAF domain-containing protein [Kitasatospora sp. MAP12-44]